MKVLKNFTISSISIKKYHLIILEFLKSEDMRVEMAMKFVAQCNPFAQQKAGGQKPPPRCLTGETNIKLSII